MNWKWGRPSREPVTVTIVVTSYIGGRINRRPPPARQPLVARRCSVAMGVCLPTMIALPPNSAAMSSQAGPSSLGFQPRHGVFSHEAHLRTIHVVEPLAESINSAAPPG